ncbi:Mov34/MPN/PAD-1 family protein [Mycolicibacterium neoaurum]|uniref:Mov34/MPN/PAD-1 family protein n=1 Tax=Mycolicibacterium neoaurum TaxID=1795 RepID=UPI003559247D
MFSAAAQAHPNETGGILIGVYQKGHPWVTKVIEVPTSDRGRSHFRLPAGVDHSAVATARMQDPRLGYLGDWHSHPHDVGHSPRDLATLALISVRSPLQPNPTQIVVRKANHGYTLDARRLVMVSVKSCSITLTGGLPELEPPSGATTPSSEFPSSATDTQEEVPDEP